MKKTIVALGTACALSVTPILADHLKESLSGMLKKKEETPSMVNLSGIGLGGKTTSPKPKGHTPNAVIAVVEGKKIIKKDADAYLEKRTKGKIKDFDLLPKEQRMTLVRELSLPILLAKKAHASLSRDEQDALISRAWMMNAVSQSNIPDEQIKAAYNRLRAQAKAKNALQQLPPLDKIRDRLKMQIAEQQIIGQLMRGVDVKVEPASKKAAGYAGTIPISVEEANRLLQRMSKGKLTWEKLPEKEKLRVLHMIAPAKLIAHTANNALTQDQKDTVLANFWMQKGLSEITVSDKEVKDRYVKIKKMVKKSKNKKKFPEFSTLERSLKMQIAREKFVQSLTKNAKIKLK